MELKLTTQTGRASTKSVELSDANFGIDFNEIKRDRVYKVCEMASIDFIDELSDGIDTKIGERGIKLSGGQIRLVDIATILTLADLQSYIQDISFNTIIFDEIFDGLDEENIKYVAGVLKEINENKTVFIITHRHIDALETNHEINLCNC